ncbi:hypothetical protein GJ496_006049 [Pomphorhynchus laevis]|nr:hypothetical protein GJ496_006049 [Pomphorhynchus laevis]
MTIIISDTDDLDMKTKDQLGIKEALDIKSDLLRKAYPQVKFYNGTVQAYITTWNPATNKDRVAQINGIPSINTTWLTKVRKTKCSIVPRLLFEDWDINELKNMANRNGFRRVSKLISKFVDKYKFNGIIIEVHPLLPKLFYTELREFLHILHQLLSANNSGVLGIVYSVQFNWKQESLYNIAEVVDFFTVNAYDQLSEGGIAPYQWMENLIKSIPQDIRKQFLVGINFYGYTFKGDRNADAITGPDFIRWLNAEPNIVVNWNPNTKEHWFQAGTKVVIYPTATSFYYRLKIIDNLNAGGIAIWELGQVRTCSAMSLAYTSSACLNVYIKPIIHMNRSLLFEAALQQLTR